MPYSEAECLDALQEAVDKLGHAPTVEEYDALDLSPSWNTIQHRCGGWIAAREKLGLEREHEPMYSKQDCLDAIQRAAEELGEEPSGWQYQNLGLSPSMNTIYNVCESWTGAKEEAGVTD